jgi:glutaconate CoA-transferase subunit B
MSETIETSAGAASTNELFAILLARDLRAEDRTIMVGANMPMARAAAVLANLTTHPDARILIGLGVQNLGDGAPPPAVHPFVFDPRTLAAEALMFQGRVFDDMSRPDVFFVGGLQLDRRGNLNLFGIPDGNGGWKMRGPGSIALATMSAHCRGYYVVMPSHDPRTFVERVALISALGDRRERARLRLPGGGIRLVLSPLGVFDFGEDGDMRVRSLHAGVTPDALRAATGFDLHVPDDAPTTPPPTPAELALLRERVDVHGTLA